MAMKIGQIAKLLGVSTQTVRYYEQSGLISPSRAGDGQYREYSNEDLLKLFDCGFLRGVDIPVKQIAQAIHAPSTGYIAELFSSRAAKLRKQAAYDIACAAYLEDLNRVFQTLPYSLNRGAYWIWPTHYQMDYSSSKGKNILSGVERADSLVSTWIQAAPFAYCQNQFESAALPYRFEGSNARLSIIISKAHAAMLDLPLNDKVITIPEQLCVSVYVESDETFALDPAQLQPALDMIEENQQEICAPISQLIMLPSSKEGGRSRYYRVLIPVRLRNNEQTP